MGSLDVTKRRYCIRRNILRQDQKSVSRGLLSLVHHVRPASNNLIKIQAFTRISVQLHTVTFVCTLLHGILQFTWRSTKWQYPWKQLPYRHNNNTFLNSRADLCVSSSKLIHFANKPSSFFRHLFQREEWYFGEVLPCRYPWRSTPVVVFPLLYC